MNSRPGARLLPLDAFRGLIMLLMALDHVRDYFSNSRFSPLDLTHTTPALFLTRWVTHLCAPGFVLTAGISARMWAASNGKSHGELARFLLTRGLWLILLELTFVHLAWFLTLDYEILLLQVIWIIGWSMIALAGMIFLPDWLILALAAALIGGHNLLDGFAPGGGDAGRLVWGLLHRPGFFPVDPTHSVYVLYPLLPWPGVMALGYVLGGWYQGSAEVRTKRLLRLGGALLAGFIILRFINHYGDMGHWFPQRNLILTAMAFLNVEKYPPSLLFLLATLGLDLLLLGALERLRGAWMGFLAVYGRVPLFFYLLHLFIIHLGAVGLAMLRYGRAEWLFGAAWFFREGYPADYGYNLPGVYLAWVLVVLALYPACKIYARIKARHPGGLLGYL